jgi:hypothetical protein
MFRLDSQTIDTLHHRSPKYNNWSPCANKVLLIKSNAGYKRGRPVLTFPGSLCTPPQVQGPLAHLAEQQTFNLLVLGSTPRRLTRPLPVA